jgi:hypothetical protein
MGLLSLAAYISTLWYWSLILTIWLSLDLYSANTYLSCQPEPSVKTPFHPLSFDSNSLACERRKKSTRNKPVLNMTSSNDPMETEPKEKKLGNIRLHDGETKQIILIPKPTSDPNDPLNWSKAYRIYIACLVSCAIFFSNFLAAGPSVAMVAITTDYFGPPTDPRFAQWTAKAAYLFTSTALLQGMGNLFWVPMMVKFGRRPVYVISFTIYTAVSAWAGAEASFDRALAARILMGFASGAAECLAPLTIADIFFLHERGTVMA